MSQLPFCPNKPINAIKFGTINSESKLKFKRKYLFDNNFLSKIIYLKADINYTYIYLNNKSIIKAAYSIKVFESILSPHSIFTRVHKNAIINKNFIASFDDIDHFVILKNGSQIQISRRRIEQFEDENIVIKARKHK